MRTRRAVLVGVAVVAAVAVVGAAFLGLGGQPLDPPSSSPTGTSPPPEDESELHRLWLSDTTRDILGNHHVAVGGRVDGESVVLAPISGHAPGGTPHDHGGDGHDHDHGEAVGCALVALDGDTGEVRWRDAVPDQNCTIHSVADPTLADVDGDGTAEVLATSTERSVAAYEVASGERVFEYPLSSYGYARPVVADVSGDGRPEVVVADVEGSVFVVRPDGEPVWTREFDAAVWGQPHVRDFDGDGGPEVALGLGSGRVVLLDADGSVAWNVSAAEAAVTWATVADLDDDAAVEFVAATTDGEVVVLDGRDGSVDWRRDVGSYAAVHAVGDVAADATAGEGTDPGDGTPEVYVTARDGTLRALSGDDGTTLWTTRVTDADVQMMPPPSLGDLDGDGTPELVVGANDGTVAVVDPRSGEVVATAGRDAPIYTHTTLADLDGDGDREIVAMYGDGRVAALDADGPDG